MSMLHLLLGKSASLRRLPSAWLWLLLPILVGMAASLTELWEQDVFWQVRSGQHLWETGLWSYPDPWSFTADGHWWHDRQWIATALMGAAAWIGDIPALILLRAAVVGILLATLTPIILRVIGDQKRGISASVALIPLIYTGMAPRIQIRPDFIMLIPYALIITVWTSPASLRSKWMGSTVLMILAANIHPGTALFALLLALGLGIQAISSREPSPKSTLAMGALFVLSQVGAWLCTPHYTTLWPYLERHLFYGSKVNTINPDHDPLTLSNFDPRDLGPWASVTLALTLISYAGLVSKKVRANLPGVYRHPLITGGLLTLFAALTWNRQRAVPFLIIPQIPILAAWFKGTAERIRWAPLASTLVAMSLFAWQAYKNPAPFGLRLNRPLFPVDTVEFIRQHGPQGPILHIPRWGDYLHYALPTYAVFADSREMPFDHIRIDMLAMYNDPDRMHRILQRYGINTVLFPLDFFMRPWGEGTVPWHRRQVFFPPKEWAVIAYDNVSMVLVRRIPAHEELIAQNAYRMLIPDVPLSGYIKSPDRDPEMDTIYEAEIARCRSQLPRTDYCVLVESRWLRRDQTTDGITASRQVLERELAQNPPRINLKIELTRVYRLAGLDALWRSMSATLSPEELALSGESPDLWWR